MKTDHPFEPAATPGRNPYRFPPGLYQLCVQKVDVQFAPGGEILRCIVKLVFAVFSPGPDGRLVRCAQDRIAAFVIWVLTADGTWEPLDRDRPLLAALGAPKSLNRDDVKKEILSLSGRWIEGRPGPADPEGFNSLVEFRSIDPPPLGTPSGSPPAATLGPAPEGAETRGRMTTADEGTEPRKRLASDPLLSLDDRTFSITWRGKTCFLGNNGSFKLLKLLESRRGRYIGHNEIGEMCCDDELATGSAIRQLKKRLVKQLIDRKMDDLAAAIKTQRSHYGLFL
jgi:hypothetical protein